MCHPFSAAAINHAAAVLYAFQSGLPLSWLRSVGSTVPFRFCGSGSCEGLVCSMVPCQMWISGRLIVVTATRDAWAEA